AEHENAVRGRGYIHSLADLESIPVKVGADGTPVTLRDLGQVRLGPEQRRGLAELNGEGEVVGGIVIMRQRQNALNVIEGLKRRLREVQASLPPGVRVVVTYDRSELIQCAVHTLWHELLQEMLIVSAVIVLFLFHFRSALIPILTLPIAVVLAFTKTFSMGFAALLAVTLTPALAAWFIRGRIRAESEHPMSRLLVRWYAPVVRFAVRRRRWVVFGASLMLLSTIPVFLRLGSE